MITLALITVLYLVIFTLAWALCRATAAAHLEPPMAPVPAGVPRDHG